MGYLSEVTELVGETEKDETQNGDINVLVVEDEDMVAEMYHEWLSEEGYDSEVVNSGVEALKAVDQKTDVVLLDRRMPFIPGDVVLDVIGSEDIKDIVRNVQSKNLDCQICLVTAVEPDVDIIGMNFDHYITKDVDREELFEAVEELSTLDDLDEDIQEYQSLYWKVQILKDSKSESELEENEKYQKLQERMDEIEERSEEVQRIKEIDIHTQ